MSSALQAYAQVHAKLCTLNEEQGALLREMSEEHEALLRQNRELKKEASMAKLKSAKSLLELMLEVAHNATEGVLHGHEDDIREMQYVLRLEFAFDAKRDLENQWETLCERYRGRILKWCSDVCERFAAAVGCTKETLQGGLLVSSIEGCYALLAIASPYNDDDAEYLRGLVDKCFSGLELEILVALVERLIEEGEIEEGEWKWQCDSDTTLYLEELDVNIPKRVVEYLATAMSNTAPWDAMLRAAPGSAPQPSPPLAPEIPLVPVVAAAPSQLVQLPQQPQEPPRKKLKSMHFNDMVMAGEQQSGKRQMQCSECGQRYKTALDGSPSKFMREHMKGCTGTFVDAFN